MPGTTRRTPADPPTGEQLDAAAAATADPETVPVHVAWARVMRDVGSIAKSSRNEQQGFNFRGVDATMNTCGPIFRKHGVFVIPEATETVGDERYPTSSGRGMMHNVRQRVTYRVYGPNGDSFTMQTDGESADAGDKATPKAHSVSYRTALLQALCVPTGDPDPDAESHERAAGNDAPAQQTQARPAADPRTQLWADIAAKGKMAGLSLDEVRADYLQRNGHQIDGPEATPAELTAYFHAMTTPPADTALTAANATQDGA